MTVAGLNDFVYKMVCLRLEAGHHEDDVALEAWSAWENWGRTYIDGCFESHKSPIDDSPQTPLLLNVVEAAQWVVADTAYLEGHPGTKAGDAHLALVESLEALDGVDVTGEEKA
jgi:hypothetical protein